MNDYMVTRKLTNKVSGHAIVQSEGELTHTVLDIPQRGGWIKLSHPVLSYKEQHEIYGDKPRPRKIDPRHFPKRPKILKVPVPYWKPMQLPGTNPAVYVLDPIYSTADDLVDNPGDPVQIQSLVNKLYQATADRFAGKSGILQRQVYGVRCKSSMRGVAVPESRLKYTEVGLPHRFAKQAGIEEGDYVLLTRSPILHGGSVIVLQARYTKGYCIYTHPLVNTPLGLDHDGDEVAVIRVPDQATREVQWKLGTHLKKSSWPVELRGYLIQGTEETKSCFSDTSIDEMDPDKDTQRRVSFCQYYEMIPSEVLTENIELVLRPRMARLLKENNKVPEDLPNYSAGMGLDAWKRKAQESMLELAFSKIFLGTVGSLTTTAAVVCMEDRDKLEKAMRFKEHATQRLLDNKHSDLQGFDPRTLLAMLTRQGKYQECTQKELLEEMLKMGMDETISNDFLEVLWPLEDDSTGVYDLMRMYPELQVMYGRRVPEAIAKLSDGWRSEHGILQALNKHAPVFEGNAPITGRNLEEMVDKLVEAL